MNFRNWFRPAPAKKAKRLFRPSVESLEHRVTPSITTTYSGGTLTVTESGSTAAQSVVLVGGTATAANTVQLTIDTRLVGSYLNVSSVNVTLNNGAGDSVAATVTAGKTWSSNLTVTEGAGAGDAFSLEGGAGTTTMTGHVYVTQGAGAGDTIKIGDTGSIVITGATMLTGNAGPGTAITLGGSTTTATFSGGLTITNANSITIGAGSSVPGNLTLNTSSMGANASLIIDGSVLGNVSFTGGSSTNTLTIDGTIGGTVTFNGGSGTNVLNVADSANATLGKSLSFSGTGADTFNFGSNSTVATVGTNVSLNFGNATNTYNLAGAFVIGGYLSVTAGNTIAGNSLTLGSGTIDGNVTVNFGNSAAANSFTISGGAINGGTVSYTGGSFGDTVTVSTTGGGYALDLYMDGAVGGGTDTVNLSTVTTLASLYISENAGATVSWTPPVSGFSSYPTTFINWP